MLGRSNSRGVRKVGPGLPMRDAGPISWMGSLKHRSSRETTMVGRGASLDGCLFLGGTDGSNPVPSGGESANHRHDRLMAEVPARISDRRVLGLILESLGASAHSSQDPSR